MQTQEHCHGVVRKTETEEGRVGLQLICSGSCEKGECQRRTSRDHHGTVTKWCSCDESPGGCNIYIEEKADGTKRFDCFTLGCDPGWECKLQVIKTERTAGGTITEYACACVRIGPAAA